MPDATKRLQLLIEAKASTAGLVGLKREMGGMFDAQKTQALKAKLHWEEAEAAAGRAARAQVRAVESVTKAEERAATLRQRYIQSVLDGNIRAAERYETAWTQAIRRVQVAQETATGARGLAGTTAADAAAARGGYTRARVMGAVAGGVGALGTGVMGLGVLGIGAGYELGKAGMNWQTYAAQQRANSPMSNAEFRAYQRRAMAMAIATGARPEDILLAERYGAERGYGGRTNRGVLQAGLMLGLPTGGTEALAPSEQAIITLLKNFPSLRGNAKKAAGMILAAAQNSAGTTVPEFVNAIPQTLTTAGHYGPKNAPDSLAIIAALTQAGVPIDEANTMAYNLISRVATPTPAVSKYLAGLKKDKGIDLTRDFSPQAVSQKGIINVLRDIEGANLDPSSLRHLFPYMRAYMGALGLTGNFANSAVNIRDRISGGAGDQALNQNYKRYLGLDSTKAKELNEQFDVMSKTLGMSLLPGILQLEKELIPLGKNFSQWTKENKGTITSLIQMSPKLILVGGGLKALGLLLGSANGGIIGKLGMFSAKMLGIRGASFAAKGGLVALGEEASGAIGVAGTGAAAGAGVLGLASALGILAAAIGQVKLMQKAAGNDNIGGILSMLAGPIFGLPMAENVAAARWIAGQLGIGKSKGTGSGQAGRGRRDSSGNPSGAVPNGALFGDPGYKGLNELTNPNYPGGRAGAIAAAGVPGAVVHSDIPMPAKSAVKLPGPRAARYRLLDAGGTYGDPGGLHELWGTPNGGKMMFYHLSDNNVRFLAGTGDGKGWYHGGQTVAISGDTGTNTSGAHLHVGMDAKARDYIYGMTWGQGWSGGKPGSLPKAGAGAGLMLAGMGNESKYAGSFQAAGSKSHVDPSLLSGVGMAESSGFTYPGPGGTPGTVNSQGYGIMGIQGVAGAPSSGVGYQIGHSASYLRDRINWLMKNPAYVRRHAAAAKGVLARLGIKNPGQNEIILTIAVASYNTGLNGDVDGVGMTYAYTVLSASMKANHGRFPSTYYTGQGDGRVPSGSSGSTGQVHYNGPGKANPFANYKPADWANYWGGLASDTAGSMSSFFPGVFNSNKDPRNLPKWKRAIFDKLAQRKAFDEYEQYRSTVMADPNLSQAEKHRLISAAWKHYMYRHGHPEAEYIKRSRDNNMAEIRSDFLVGRERYKPPHHHPTGHPGKKPHPLMDQQKTLVRQGDDHSKKLTKMVQLLQSIDKRLGGGGDPRQSGQTMLHSPGH